MSLIVSQSGQTNLYKLSGYCGEEIPVVLVHGYYGDPNNTWQTMKQKLQQDGFTVYSVDLEPGVLPANGEITGYAGTLQNFIQQVKKQTGASRVDLVVHSMGGLVSRWYIQQALYGSDVRNLIMLGTPNHGSELLGIAATIFAVSGFIPGWLPAVLGISGILALGNSGLEMIPDSAFLNLLNYGTISSQNTPEIISSTVIYSSTAGAEDFILTKYFLPGSDDGFVSTTSVALTNVVPLLFNATHLGLHEDNDVYGLVKSILLGQKINVKGGDDIPGKINQFTFSKLVTGALVPGNTAMHQVIIDGSIGQALFLLSWKDGGMNITLVAPDGEVYDASTTNPNAVYFEDSNASSSGFIIQNPLVGVWNITVVNPSTSKGKIALIGEGTALNNPYSVTIFGDSTIILTGNAYPSSANSTQPVLLTAKLFDGSVEIINASVTAFITDPSSNLTSLTLFDDGLHNDGNANDGVYANTFTQTEQNGIYAIIAHATGSYGGGFERTVVVNLAVESFPDLTPVQINLPKNLYAGLSTKISARITNIGDVSTPVVQVVFSDGHPSNGNIIRSATLAGLAPGQNGQVSATWMPQPVGTHQVYVLVSPYQPFLEKDYENNIISTSVNVVKAPSATSQGDKRN